MTHEEIRPTEAAEPGRRTSGTEPLDLDDALKWLDHVRSHGAGALSIEQYFDGTTSWSRSFEKSMRQADPDDLERYNPAEVYGVLYMNDAVREAIHQRLETRGDV